MEVISCNHCGSASSETLHVLPDLLLDRPEIQATLVRCLNCGLVYQNPRPTIEQMAAHYPPEYDSFEPDPAGKRAGWLLQRALQVGARKRVQTVLRVRQGGRLLDVGCSTGAFLLAMRKAPGWDLTGVEISPHAAEIARRQGLNVITGTLEAARFADQSFDAVTLWDVLEHLHDPAAALAELHRILGPGGVLVLRVPNLDSWDARVFGRHWAGLDAPRHTYVFDLSSLRNMVTAAGFKAIRMKTNIGGYPTFVLSIRFWMTDRGIDERKRRRILRWLLHPAARILSAPLFFLTGLGLRGPQVTLSCRR